MKKNYILFIDSGLGGLTTLHETLLVTKAEIIYFADTAFAPYGNKTTSFLRHRLKKIIDDMLKKYAIFAVVLACNTATTNAIDYLRKTYPNLYFIGTEPALKLAKDKGFLNPAIIATPQTINRLKGKISVKENLFPCPKLAEQIEANFIHPTPANSLNLLKSIYSLAWQTQSNACLVLGCTHYPFIKYKLKKITGKPIFDGNNGVARRIFNLFGNFSQKSSVKIVISNKNPKELQKYKKILKQILAKQIKL